MKRAVGVTSIEDQEGEKSPVENKDTSEKVEKRWMERGEIKKNMHGRWETKEGISSLLSIIILACSKRKREKTWKRRRRRSWYILLRLLRPNWNRRKQDDTKFGTPPPPHKGLFVVCHIHLIELTLLLGQPAFSSRTTRNEELLLFFEEWFSGKGNIDAYSRPWYCLKNQETKELVVSA